MRFHGLAARLALVSMASLSALGPISGGCGDGVSAADPAAEPATAEAAEMLQWVIQDKLLTSDTNPYNYLGWAVSISGDTAAVGAYRADGDRGATYVFVRSGETWTEEARLTAMNGQPGDLFGGAVALEGDTLVVGAPFDTAGALYSGAAYVFTRSGGQWTEQARLTASDGSQGDALGWSASISGETVVLGAYNVIQGIFAEAAYVFVRSGGQWTEEAKLTADDGQVGDTFGIAVSISGDTAVVGAAEDDAPSQRSGSAYVFTRSGGQWTQESKLTASDGTSGDIFGTSVALSGDTAVIGAMFDNALAVDSGSAYVFARDGAAWTEQAKLLPHDGGANHFFGGAVAIFGDTAVVGASQLDPDGNGPAEAPGPGLAYVYSRSAGVWAQTQQLTANDGLVNDWFGISVAVEADTVVVGAVEDDSQFLDDTGSAYVFVLRASIGEACAENTECASGFCADGVCCDAACDGECAACSAAKKGSGLDGACGPVADSTDPDGECAPLSCGGGACLTSCATTRQCVQGHYCDPSSKGCEILPVDIGDRGVCSAAPDRSAGASPRWIGLLGLGLGLVMLRRRRPFRRGHRAAMPRAAFPAGVVLALGSSACGPAEPGAPREASRAAASPLEAEPVVTAEQAILAAGDGEADDFFGGRAAIAGDMALVGAHLDDGSGIQSGSAYIFVRGGEAWTAQAKLTAGDGAADDNFGVALALVGETALVGAPNSGGRGAVYVFERSGPGWIQQGKLTAGDGLEGDQFGAAIAASEGTLVVGAPGSDTVANQSGSAYVFVRVDGGWLEQAKLGPGDGALNDRFGASVAVSGATAVIGATFEDDQAVDSGSVYVFGSDAGLWMEQAKLKASDAASDDLFGTSVALAADTLVVGALFHDVPASNAGAAYVFVRAEGQWIEEARLLASDGAAEDHFGSSVAVAGDTVVVGAPARNGPVGTALMDSGSAHVFMRIGGWAERAELRASDGAEADTYGASVAVAGDTVVVGAPGKNEAGAAYVHLLGAPGYCEDATHSVDPKPPGAPEGVTTDCAPRRCDQESGVCLASCQSTEECVAGYYCHPSTNDCEPQPDRDIGDERACSAAPGQPARARALVSLIAAAALGLSIARRRRGSAPSPSGPRRVAQGKRWAPRGLRVR